MLVNARQIPGRKTDVADAVWLADLAAHGLVRGSFVPDLEIKELKELVRARTGLVRSRLGGGPEAGEAAGIGGAEAVLGDRDINGLSGRRMIEALIAGERDPEVLASLGDGRLKATKADLAEALTGRFSEHHGFLARVRLDLIDAYTAQIAGLSARIEAYFADDSRSGPPVSPASDRPASCWRPSPASQPGPLSRSWPRSGPT